MSICICLKLILRIFFASKSTREDSAWSLLALVPKLWQSFVLVSVFVFVFALVLALKPIREDSAYCWLAPEPKLLQASDFRAPDQLLLLHQLIITVTESQKGHWLSFHGHCWLLTIISFLGAPRSSRVARCPSATITITLWEASSPSSCSQHLSSLPLQDRSRRQYVVTTINADWKQYGTTPVSNSPIPPPP